MSEYDALLEPEPEPQASQYDALLEDDGPLPIPQTTQPPEAIAREPLDPVKQPKIGATDAANLGMGQGAFGLGDEVTSAMRAVRDTALTPERKWENTLNLYRAYKANQARDMGRAQSQQPVAWMAGNLPSAALTGIVSAAAVPAAAMKAAPIGANLITNAAQSMAQNWGQDTLTPWSVMGDVAAGAALGGAMHVAARGPARTVGDIMQLPQRGVDAASDWLGSTKIGQALGSNADELGENMVSKRVKDLRLAKQSYLTEAGKQNVAASQKISGTDLPSRLAAAAVQGAADLGPGNWTMNPTHFGDDFFDMSQTAANFSLDKHYPQLRNTAFDVEGKFDIARQMKGPNAATAWQQMGADYKRDLSADIGNNLSSARDVLEQYRAMKAAEAQAMSGAQGAADELQRIKTGRGAIQNVAGIAGGGSAGGSFGGPVGAILGVAGGKQLGKGALQSIDLTGEVGQRLSAMVSIAQRWATRDDRLGQAAQWALSGEGPAFIARLATLADLPEAQDELKTSGQPTALP